MHGEVGPRWSVVCLHKRDPGRNMGLWSGFENTAAYAVRTFRCSASLDSLNRDFQIRSVRANKQHGRVRETVGSHSNPIGDLKGDLALDPSAQGPLLPNAAPARPAEKLTHPCLLRTLTIIHQKPKVWSGNVIFHPAISDVSGLRGPDSRRSEIRSSVHDMRHRVDQFHDIYHQNG